jgi:lipopolysaccharide exporter
MDEKNHPYLFKRTIASVTWVAAMRVSAQILSTARLFVLAWFLSSSDFGLMGIALLTMTFLETFTETGFMYALVQKPQLDKADLDSAWSVSLLRGMVVCVAMCLAAPFVAAFFEHSADPAKAQAAAANHDLAVWVIRAFSLTIVFRMVTNIGIVNFRRGLEFNKLFVIDTIGLIIDVLIAIAVAVIFKSVWALVFGKLACEAVRCVMSYIVSPYRPSFRIDRSRSSELWRFGKWMFWSAATFYFLSQGDSLVVGRVLGLAALGIYQMAGRISALPMTEISNVISQVTFPVFSRIQDDLPRLRAAHMRIYKATALLSSLVMALTVVFIPDVTRLFLKPEWYPIVPIVQILAINGFFMSLGATFGPAFQAIGKPKTPARFGFVKLVIFAALIYPATVYWGLNGAASVLLFSTLVIQVPLYTTFSRMVGSSARKLAQACLMPIVASVVMVIAVMAIRMLLWPAPSLYQMVPIVIIAIALYAGSVLLLDHLFSQGVLETIKQLANELPGRKRAG